jgi:restriction system protein
MATALAVCHGRTETMECDHLKYLCGEYLGLDVLVSLPPPPGRR